MPPLSTLLYYGLERQGGCGDRLHFGMRWRGREEIETRCIKNNIFREIKGSGKTEESIYNQIIKSLQQ
jgi:hypothetical protein